MSVRPITSATPTDRRHSIAMRWPTALSGFSRTSLMLLSRPSAYMPALAYRLHSLSWFASLFGSARTAFLASLIFSVSPPSSAFLASPGPSPSSPSPDSSCITL